MKTLDLSEKLYTRFDETKDLCHYFGIIAVWGLIKTAEQKNDEALLNCALDKIRKFAFEMKHVPYNFPSYKICGIAAAYAFMKGYIPEFKDLIEEYAEELMHADRDCDGILISPRQKDRELIWIDCLTAAVPFLLYAGLALGREDYIDEAVDQALKTYDLLIDKENGLLHQCKNFIATGVLTEDHWGRGNGWGYIALAELVQYLPKTHKKRKTVEEYFGIHSVNLLKVQNYRGMWTQEMTMHESYEEISGTGLVLYGYGVGIQTKVLDPEVFSESFEMGIRSLYKVGVNDDFSTNNCCPACRCPGKGVKKGTIAAYVAHPPVKDDVHSFGPLMLAFTKAFELGMADI